MALQGFFIEISAHYGMLISMAFFPWLGVDPTLVLLLKEGPHRTHQWLNKMKKKEEEKEKNQKNHFPLIWTHKFCLQSWALYPLDHGSLPIH